MCNGKPDFKIAKSFPAFVSLDADNAFGHAAGFKSIDIGMELANKFGIAAISVKNSSHPGAMASFSLKAARNGFCSFAFTHADSLIQSFNSKDSFFGTNPIAFAYPVPGKTPIVYDMATAAMAQGEVQIAARDGKKVPLGTGLSRNGELTEDPKKILEGVLLPFGGYKGFALGSSIDLLLGCIGGSSNASGWEFGNNAQFFAIKSITKKNTISYSDIKEYFGEDIPGLAEVNAEEESIKLGVNIDEITANLLSLN